EPALVGLAEIEEVQDHAHQAARLVADRGRGASGTLGRPWIPQHALRLELDRADRVLEVVDEEARELLLVQLEPLERVALAAHLVVELGALPGELARAHRG